MTTLLLRSIGPRDYTVLEGEQRIGRIRWAKERSPGVWLWHIQVHIPGAPFGSAKDLDEAKAAFKAAWAAMKLKHSADDFARAFKAMNIRGDG
ncbi:hypothetical protein AC629_42570 [Bradyrhizobium sp. NAS80.1]|uniref:hypothetical protein n=1 Tax=Bradyrhizobium sp. NAS80.1 TaxID=1680159 RepID=UPI00095C6CBE|nr:hypothetical protein [Bradyrhizobium sp. NAS80.1]OKO67670.1 hypothetical protein AC629_42570 [Bradyrhizobium sp. NAS80.1]